LGNHTKLPEERKSIFNYKEITGKNCGGAKFSTLGIKNVFKLDYKDDSGATGKMKSDQTRTGNPSRPTKRGQRAAM